MAFLFAAPPILEHESKRNPAHSEQHPEPDVSGAPLENSGDYRVGIGDHESPSDRSRRQSQGSQASGRSLAARGDTYQ